MCKQCMRVVIPLGLQGKGKNAVCETWRHLGDPKFSTNVAKRTERTERTQMCKFVGDFLSRFRWKNDDFGGPAPPCGGLGQGLESGVQKNELCRERPPPFGHIFCNIRLFWTLYFSVIFEVTSDSEL